jgi:hypothetical protein
MLRRKTRGAAGVHQMPIGEFGGAPQLPNQTVPAFSTGLYWLYEMGQAALNPSRALADMTRLSLKNPLNPLSNTTFGKTMAAAAEVFESMTPLSAASMCRFTSRPCGSDRSAISCISSAPSSTRRAGRSRNF